ncbi:MAG: SUMF1/EgtB/PvdO family nonheme iron enzyme [Proteobacteria bacterium]|nr:SUMF1/EgtB/PvdO family nonheme iron enzyme [Pseudomonadota bacterium]
MAFRERELAEPPMPPSAWEGLSTDPTGAGNGFSRVVRGGSWGDDASDCRAAARAARPPRERFHTIGFRLLRTTP